MFRASGPIPSLLLAALLLFAPAPACALTDESAPPATQSPLVTDWARWWHELSTPSEREPIPPLSLADPATGEPNHLIAALLTGGVLAGSALNSFTETPRQSFHFTNEGWFGRNTYAGGADKASHFVDYHMVSKELGNFYTVLGYSRTQSILLGAAVSSFTGLMTELGDGVTFFGFSYEDFVMDVAGAGTAALLAYTRTDDLFGFRRGFIPNSTGIDRCCERRVGKGHDYSNEIYTADLKLAGVARRSGLALGPLRYLLLSVTYGSSGYANSNLDKRERLVGFELGLNFEEILNDVGVRRTTWWGYALHVVLDNMRIPFTSIGARYDMNHGKWQGPGP